MSECRVCAESKTGLCGLHADRIYGKAPKASIQLGKPRPIHIESGSRRYDKASPFTARSGAAPNALRPGPYAHRHLRRPEKEHQFMFGQWSKGRRESVSGESQ